MITRVVLSAAPAINAGIHAAKPRRESSRGAELVGELERYNDTYWLCYVHGPEGIIIELAEQIG